MFLFLARSVQGRIKGGTKMVHGGPKVDKRTAHRDCKTELKESIEQNVLSEQGLKYCMNCN